MTLFIIHTAIRSRDTRTSYAGYAVVADTYKDAEKKLEESGLLSNDTVVYEEILRTEAVQRDLALIHFGSRTLEI